MFARAALLASESERCARGRMNLLILGPQGAGKGTQATRISAEYGIPHISTGDMFRAAISAQTELGRAIEPIYMAGSLVPDDLTFQMIRERLALPDAQAGFVLDGFPRNLAQAEALDDLLAEIGRSLDAVLFLDVDEDVATRRALGRAGAEARSDDTADVIARRLATYRDETMPVVERYRATGKLVPLQADRPIDAVFAEIQTALELVAARVSG
jgi:adenylate kinase